MRDKDPPRWEVLPHKLIKDYTECVEICFIAVDLGDWFYEGLGRNSVTTYIS